MEYLPPIMLMKYHSPSLQMSNRFIGLCLILVFTSCQVIVDIDPVEYEPVLVLNCILADDSIGLPIQNLTLTASKDILDSSTSYLPIGGADIALYEDNILVATAAEYQAGYYGFNYSPKAGSTYKIAANAANYTPAISESTIPFPAADISIDEFTPIPEGNFEKEQTYRLTYTIDDVEGDDYYDTELYISYTTGSIESGSLNRRIVKVSFRELGANLELLDEEDTSRVFSDALFDGKRHTRTIEFDYWNKEKIVSEHTDILLDVRHCSEAYYAYFTSIENQVNSKENPFSEPVPVYNNIENGLGIFASYSSNIVSFRLR